MRLAAALLTLLLAGGAHAVGTPPEANVRSSIDPAIMKIDEARFLGQPLARETALLDEDGKRFFLGDMLGQAPDSGPVLLRLRRFYARP